MATSSPWTLAIYNHIQNYMESTILLLSLQMTKPWIKALGFVFQHVTHGVTLSVSSGK